MTYALKLEQPAKTKPALKLVRTQDLSRDEWLTVRRQGIGSSDAAAAVGLNPYKSQLQLWMEKTGRDGALPVVDPNDDQSPMYWGTLLEPIVAAHYTRRSGHRVRRVNAVVHEALPAVQGTGGLIAVDRQGNVCLPFNTEGMYRGLARVGQAPESFIYR